MASGNESSMVDEADLAGLLASWGHFAPRGLRALGGAGGFSGSEFWRFESQEREWCLRRWPPAQEPKRLAWIHRVLQFLGQEGLEFLPLPQENCRHDTIQIDTDRRLWELTPWMEGEPERSPPESSTPLRLARVEAALQTLARFHVMAAQYPQEILRRGPSAGLGQRLEMLRSFDRQVSEVRRSFDSGWGSQLELPLKTLGFRWFSLAPFWVRQLQPRVAAFAEKNFRLQICIRDIWSEHVLFEPDSPRVSGVVDFGAMRVDCVAGDIARLIASYADDDKTLWTRSLEAYEAIRPLSEQERQAVTLFDESSIVLSGLNWLRWIYVEGRIFEELPLVEQRLQQQLTRLERRVGRQQEK